MRSRFISGVAAGMFMGAAASMLIMPQMDHKTRRRMDRTCRRITDGAGCFINELKSYTR
jgi:gas vesicle protein